MQLLKFQNHLCVLGKFNNVKMFVVVKQSLKKKIQERVSSGQLIPNHFDFCVNMS